jgi:maspardin
MLHGSKQSLLDWRRRNRPRRIDMGGRTWGVIDQKARGDRPTVVLLHGTAGRAQIWYQAMQRLRGFARVVAISYPADRNVARNTDRLAALMVKLGLPRSIVLGSSLGGYMVQFLAARHRNRLSHAVFNSTFSTTSMIGKAIPPGVEDIPGWQIRGAQVRGMATWPAKDARFSAMVKTVSQMNVRMVPAQVLKARVLSWARGVNAPMAELPQHKITVQDCADDPLVPRAALDDVVARYPRSRHVRLPEGGHFAYLVCPDAFVATLRQIIQRAG